MVLYHGSNLPVNESRLVPQARGLDSGEGFYLTASEEQAHSFSKIVVHRRKSSAATASVYEFDMDAAARGLTIRKFSGADGEWLRFVRSYEVREG